jgi:alpha-D-ribose 1-methylphosphonate 5-triphosphate synthase subunit PhnG
VADRRAAARADLLDALFQLAEAEARIRRALSVLGLNPKKPRAKRGRR